MPGRQVGIGPPPSNLELSIGNAILAESSNPIAISRFIRFFFIFEHLLRVLFFVELNACRSKFHGAARIHNKILDLLPFSEPGTIFPKMGSRAGRHLFLKILESLDR